MANAIKSVAKVIRKDPDSDDARILRSLCEALESDGTFELNNLFALKSKSFELAMQLIDEWRFDRHVASRRLQKYLERDDD